MRRVKPRRARRGRGDRGSALLLLPACTLLVVLLAALAADAAVVHLARRELLHAAAGAANDAATHGLDEAQLRQGSGLVLSPARALDAAVANLTARGLVGELARPPVVEVDATDVAVSVELVMEVDHLFAPALPGAGRRSRVTAHATAWAHAR